MASTRASTRTRATTKARVVARAVTTKATATKPVKASVTSTTQDNDGDAILAYLRIRPHLGQDEPGTPYLNPLSSTSVRITDPSPHPSSTIPSSSIYTFSHIFPPSTPQSPFFTKTTLPLIKDVLNGQNALLFAYGVTNSGKTYSVQGGTKDGSAGILPRSLDVIFNSTEGLQGDTRYLPVRLQAIELALPSTTANTTPSFTAPPTTVLAQVLADNLSSPSTDIDSTIIQLDRNYSYTIFLSYYEVYNEKIYDLLSSVSSDSSHTPTLTRKALAVKPCPPNDTDTPTSTGKYIANLRTFHITSASQAKALLSQGQLHRRVFGTLANSSSSRSHSLVTLKILRRHRGLPDDPSSIQVSRLTVVDLAGSERTRNTHTTGQRLKEAGSINKSLMVLGQCMEVMRANQRKVAQSLAVMGRGDTRDVKRGLGLVPFRHSKLTEVLMDYFVGDGRAVMIVNVNPYDTGYDENSHVMKFAALAREVHTIPAQRVPSPTKFKPTPSKSKKREPEGVLRPLTTTKRKVTIEGGKGKKGDAILEVFEEDEDKGEAGDEDHDDDPINPLVDALFDEVEELRMRLFESEMRRAIIEAETREEVMKEMEERMKSMERMYARRLMSEVEQSEMKTDAKIDLLHRSGVVGRTPVMPTLVMTGQGARRGGRSNVKGNYRVSLDEVEEKDVEMSLFNDDTQDTEDLQVTSGEEIDLREVRGSESESEEGSHSASDSHSSSSLSPLASKAKKVIRESVPRGRPSMPLPPGFDGEDEPDAEDDVTDTEEDGSSAGEDDEDEDEDESDEEWVPPPSVGRQSKASAKPRIPKVPKLEEEMSNLSLSSANDSLDFLSPLKKGLLNEGKVAGSDTRRIRSRKRP